MPHPPVILWFRRDLRLADHPALVAAVAAAKERGAPLLPIFVWEPGLITGKLSSANRTWFLRESVTELATSLRAIGSDLIELQGPAATALPLMMSELRAAGGTGDIDLFMTRDHTPFARERDHAVADLLTPLGVQLHAKRGLVVVEPEELLTGGGTPYGVYTPYFRRWLEQVDASAPLPTPKKLPPLPTPTPTSTVDRTLLDAHALPTAQIDQLPAPGERAARKYADAWQKSINKYADRRNALADNAGTSRLSAALHIGLLSARELVARQLPLPPMQEGERSGERLWVSQIAWRDFYTQVLWHAPHAASSAWRPSYDAIQWSDDQRLLEAWKSGTTGYPVVDAGMRQLAATGFMHNRARMITASFLTKDLLIDWREGEAHFLRHLVDGDIAANNGGWQWCAGSGTDAQPYFRIFNPVTQAGNFDPDGEYVRRWVPELAALQTPAIHAPWAHPKALDAAGIRLGEQYPEPIVDHAEARQRTLAAYSAALKPERG
ncbi:MAG: deoxyribodipyrimidine photo-lyase [Chloroflexi bacterium]|nr:deoxyribodipyrimidine photo-lyase [Chloroflexota bacterium]